MSSKGKTKAAASKSSIRKSPITVLVSDAAPSKMKGISITDGEVYWTEDRLENLGRELLTWIRCKDENGCSMNIWLKDFASERDMGWSSITNLSNRNAFLFQCIEVAKQIQESILFKLGLGSKGTMPQFALKNVAGWTDKSEVKHDGNIQFNEEIKTTKQIYTELELILSRNKIRMDEIDLLDESEAAGVMKDDGDQATRKVEKKKQRLAPTIEKSRKQILAQIELQRKEKEKTDAELEKKVAAEPKVSKKRTKQTYLSTARKFNFIR